MLQNVDWTRIVYLQLVTVGLYIKPNLKLQPLQLCFVFDL